MVLAKFKTSSGVSQTLLLLTPHLPRSRQKVPVLLNGEAASNNPKKLD